MQQLRKKWIRHDDYDGDRMQVIQMMMFIPGENKLDLG